MKHPGFLRLISALYIRAPLFRLLRASFDRVRLDFRGLDLARFDRRAFHHCRLDPGRIDLDGRDGALALGAGDGLRAREGGRRGRGREADLAERPVAHEPRDRTRQDEPDPQMEELELSPELRSSAGGTRGAGPALGKPGQTTCV